MDEGICRDKGERGWESIYIYIEREREREEEEEEEKLGKGLTKRRYPRLLYRLVDLEKRVI